ncbi:hypothetical protein [Chitinimonas lacunae]|uniref:Fibronectin type-III domain-containing protein n=1 Tax=Chitinimonas lacunae TaxID=1963018 RepID=A0ABV8MR20_9NEIS
MSQPVFVVPLLCLALPALASNPSVVLSEGVLTVDLPYISVNGQAYRARLQSTDGQSFRLAEAVLSDSNPGTVEPPQLSIENGRWSLQIPRFDFAGQSYAARLSSTDPLAGFTLEAGSVVAAPGLTLTNVESGTLGLSHYSSSSRLGASWYGGPAAPDHYRLVATDTVTGRMAVTRLTPGSASSVLSDLKSGTRYRVYLQACLEAACSRRASSAPVEASTDIESWLINATAPGAANAIRLVDDANVLSYGFVYGDWAGSSLSGRVRYYYNPTVREEKGLKPALSRSVVKRDDPSSATLFDKTSGYGIVINQQTSGDPRFLGQAQAVPYAGRIRLFYEATHSDNRSRIYMLDSQDGYLGLDFNRSASATSCRNGSDFAQGGACEPTLLMGVQGDSVLANPTITDLRQFRIGYPTRDSWLWDGSGGTFMVVTADLPGASQPGGETCGYRYKFLNAYARWDGSRWSIDYRDTRCPKGFEGVQAPSIAHMGGYRYKLYFSFNTVEMGKPHNPATDTKPVKVLYGEGTSHALIFEDWESVTQAREVRYLWPDGSELSVAEESKLDDYHFFAPTGESAFQVMYTAIQTTTSGSVPFVTSARLLNP